MTTRKIQNLETKLAEQDILEEEREQNLFQSDGLKYCPDCHEGPFDTAKEEGKRKLREHKKKCNNTCPYSHKAGTPCNAGKQGFRFHDRIKLAHDLDVLKRAQARVT